MSRLPPALLAPALLAIALAGALAPVPGAAEEVITSKGARSLPRLETLKSEAQLAQVERNTEQVVFQLIEDVNALEVGRNAASAGGVELKEKIRRDAADLQRAKSEFETLDQKYRTDLAAFQAAQVALEGEIQRQRTDAASVEALPSAQRDHAQVERINAWAQEIGKKREQLEAQRTTLLADHERVESERAKIAKMHRDAEARLQGQRDSAVGAFDAVEARRIAAYKQLALATRYYEQVRAMLTEAAAPRAIGHSVILDQAKARLATLEARKR